MRIGRHLAMLLEIAAMRDTRKPVADGRCSACGGTGVVPDPYGMGFVACPEGCEPIVKEEPHP